MCEESVRGLSIISGQMILVVLTGIHALRSFKPVPRCTAVRSEGGGLLTEESEVKARWAGYFERLDQADLQLSSWMSGVLHSRLLTLQSTVVHLHLWKHWLQ